MKANKILPPRIFQIAIVAIAAIHFLFPVYFLYNSPMRFVGILPIVFGAYLNIYSDWLIKKHETTIKPFDNPTTLIEIGPFKYSRNPIYLGMTLIVLGCSFISGAILSFSVPVIFAFILHLRYIVVEEGILSDNFGEVYLRYKSKVRCWI